MPTEDPAGSAPLADLVRHFPQARVWVIGDIILDEYLEGDVGRVSPEAPVQVLRVRDSSYRLGGAANVAHNARTLGAAVELCGVVGDDEAGERVLALCAAAGIGTAAVRPMAGRRTTRKVRAIARRQQLIRLDWEDATPVEPTWARELLRELGGGPRPQALVVSDYAKGLLSPALLSAVLELARGLGAPVVVDPKSPDFSRYRGATVIKPNLLEVCRATGLELAPDDTAALTAAGQQLLAQTSARALVVTLGDHGLAVLEPGRAPLFVAGERRDVYDVSGAGDTVAATLALGLAAGADVVSAARLANAAAGIEVGKAGTATVHPAELLTAVLPRSTDKIVPLAALVDRCGAWRLQQRKVVVTNGCFDLLHVGHVSLLRTAASHGDALVVAINSDASVRRLKGPGRPLVPQAERAQMIAALSCVDAVVVFDEDTPLELLQQVRPDVLVKGADYTTDQVVGGDLVLSWGGRVVLVPLVPDHSTTTLVDRIRGT